MHVLINIVACTIYDNIIGSRKNANDIKIMTPTRISEWMIFHICKTILHTTFLIALIKKTDGTLQNYQMNYVYHFIIYKI